MGTKKKSQHQPVFEDCSFAGNVSVLGLIAVDQIVILWSVISYTIIHEEHFCTR